MGDVYLVSSSIVERGVYFCDYRIIMIGRLIMGYGYDYKVRYINGKEFKLEIFVLFLNVEVC